MSSANSSCSSFTVSLPKGPALHKVMKHYNPLGFPGAVGSVDVTHVHWSCAPYSHRQLYIGKEGFATLAYEATVDHTGRLMTVTEGFLEAQNDRSIIRLDSAVATIRRNEPYISTTYTLFSEDGIPEDKAKIKEGIYLIANGDYNRWLILMCPVKYPANDRVAAWSKRLEQVRMYVECFFGVLKARFLILKKAILFRKKEGISNVMFTYCILHNMLHAMDDFDDMEAGDAVWDGANGSCEDGGEIPLEVSTKMVSDMAIEVVAEVPKDGGTVRFVTP